MRGYLQENRGRFGRIALFVTEGGSGGAKAISEMAELAGSTPVATLELTEKELKAGRSTKFARFLDAINQESQAGGADLNPTGS